MRTCSRCKQNLSLDKFNKGSAAAGGYSNNCKECNKILSREWRQKNPDRARQNSERSNQRLRETNPDYVKDWQRESYSTDEGRTKKIAANQARRARLANAQGRYTAEEFAELCLLYDGACLRCKTTDERLTVDHIVPLSLGGSNSIDNIQPLCRSCNSIKGNRSSEDYRQDFAF